MASPFATHYRETLRLGGPLVVAQLGQVLLGFADGAMIGAHDVHELAAASFCVGLFNLPLIFLLGFSYGLTPLFAQAHATGNTSQLGGLLRSGIRINLAVSFGVLALMLGVYLLLPQMHQPTHLLPLIRPYYALMLASLPPVALFCTLRQLADALGRTSLSMHVTLGGNALNIILNALLIFGYCGFPEWGLFGAGVATLIARWLMALAMVAALRLQRPFRRVVASYRRAPSPHPSMPRRILRMGGFVGMQMGLETAMFSLAVIMVGWLGDTALAAHHIAVTLQTFGFMTYYGLGAAASVRISHAWARGHVRDARRAAAGSYHIILLFALLMAGSMYMLRHPLGGLFTDSQQVIDLAATLLLVGLAYQPLDGLQVAYANALRGIGQTAPLALISLLGYCLVGLPLAYLLGFVCQLGALGIWMAFLAGLGACGLGFYLRFAWATSPQRALRLLHAEAADPSSFGSGHIA